MTQPTAYTVPAEVLTAYLEREAVLLHMGTRSYFRLNSTASLVWEGLEHGRSRAELLDGLCARFDVEPTTASGEVDRLLAELEARGLIMGPGASRG